MMNFVILVVAMFMLQLHYPPLGAMTDAASASVCPRPDVDNAPLFARWLLNQSSWGVLSTVDIATTLPFGNVHSFVDGGTGTPYFYQSTKLDRTGRNTAADSRATFTVSEYALGQGACKDDPQNPKCAKLTLLGQLRILPMNSSEANFWEAILLEKHPQFRGFPKARQFSVLKLTVSEVYLVNKPAAAANVPLPDYFGNYNNKIKEYYVQLCRPRVQHNTQAQN